MDRYEIDPTVPSDRRSEPPPDGHSPSGPKKRVSRPYWIPEGVNYDTLPVDLQSIISEIIEPAYQELVLEAPTVLEKTFGISVVYVLWLEVLGQRDLAAKMTRLMSAGDCSDAHQEAIGRYLRLLGAKVNMGKCYIQLQRHEERKWQLSPDPIRNRTGQG